LSEKVPIEKNVIYREYEAKNTKFDVA